ncbi:hypothetical protein MEC_00170 [Bartonella alsatica IBS 382]|uniref:Uncharacterized protein n=1 Tax=Bartonella alsatica IBS 382 TaxID=1094551 RepID=J0PU44_9HYPH|nr:hypothetical protein MEC_00170 [Bartonella alsatica IBS 382]
MVTAIEDFSALPLRGMVLRSDLLIFAHYYCMGNLYNKL